MATALATVPLNMAWKMRLKFVARKCGMIVLEGTTSDFGG